MFQGHQNAIIFVDAGFKPRHSLTWLTVDAYIHLSLADGRLDEPSPFRIPQLQEQPLAVLDRGCVAGLSDETRIPRAMSDP